VLANRDVLALTVGYAAAAGVSRRVEM
jgi:hypothetical protein